MENKLSIVLNSIKYWNIYTNSKVLTLGWGSFKIVYSIDDYNG